MQAELQIKVAINAKRDRKEDGLTDRDLTGHESDWEPKTSSATTV